ncbi:MAG TPA: AAA family ATPase [Burkholderiales bacterium]|nr:AAA family ATPase [Burkholderiales bacterium]
MYRTHFALREPPFSLTPDTSFAFACTPHQEALNTLLIATANGEGFMKVTGEVGTGKTLLCRRFLSQLDDEVVTAYLPNPQLDSHGLLLALAEELRVQCDRDAGEHELVKCLNLALLEYARLGKRVVVCLDEVQAMPRETLESLRLLSNLETEKRKLFQVVMFGQPELDEKLRHESIRQLQQRITFQYHLSPLSRAEVEYYVSHRLRIAGYMGDRLFNSSALDALHRSSRGVPRLINVIAHKALLAAYGEGRHYVSASHVRVAAKDTPSARRLYSPLVWAGAAAAAIVAAAISWYAKR